MGELYKGCTLGDLVGLAQERTITYRECAELLEQELGKKFPWIRPEQFYPQIKVRAVSDLDYCRRLVRAGTDLERIMKS